MMARTMKTYKQHLSVPKKTLYKKPMPCIVLDDINLHLHSPTKVMLELMRCNYYLALMEKNISADMKEEIKNRIHVLEQSKVSVCIL